MRNTNLLKGLQEGNLSSYSGAKADFCLSNLIDSFMSYKLCQMKIVTDSIFRYAPISHYSKAGRRMAPNCSLLFGWRRFSFKRNTKVSQSPMEEPQE
ncbi:hypothetical protein AVEN_80694-1 [Araneus ventricosus]|uniref:Uncharacterized protein n=1 Tax=Araneus ventricosus TaxID=182803 RepID=A0A4Y2UVE5_ARAVE|nr:hypothetical protein AVEN_40060-1 [Araneus ventricosus]GBO16192.1 hypothetical protein AVEN_80694-1 [Araneus ventricosus]